MTVFVDANLAVHATGTDPEMRERCAVIVLESSRASSRLVSSAEVLQEVFWVRQRTRGLDAARGAIELCVEAFDIVALLPEDVISAVNSRQQPGLQARDLVHLATMARLGL
ncbi:MAG TPA: type II toxin-antitoxin system VapC family toxin, partial [Tepidiformaceae bacterium]|nr:type II toxin-antitoxin system VapC family toxin [Tepidiformaceae bacterium]